jgi:HEAT repeat protein
VSTRHVVVAFVFSRLRRLPLVPAGHSPRSWMRKTVSFVVLALATGGQAPVPDLAADLAANDPAVRARAACALKEQGERASEAIGPLVRLLTDATPLDASVCRERWSRSSEDQITPGELAAAALVAIGTRSFDPLVAALQQPSWIARRNAAWALGALDDRRGIAPVSASLKDREPGVRMQAAWALGAMEAETAVKGLLAALADDDPRVRKQAAWALGVIEDAAAVEKLIEALRDRSDDVREQAAWALGVIGDSRASQGLVAALKDAEPGVRRQAAWALGVIGR